MKVDQVNLRVTCHKRPPLVVLREANQAAEVGAREVKFERVDVCLGTLRVARLLCDPELATFSWGAEVFLPGARPPPRSRTYDDALRKVRQSIVAWLHGAKLQQEDER